MKSESLRRFAGEQQAVQQRENPDRAQIAADVASFLARGGEIQRIDQHVGTQPVFSFQLGEKDRQHHNDKTRLKR